MKFGQLAVKYNDAGYCRETESQTVSGRRTVLRHWLSCPPPQSQYRNLTSSWSAFPTYSEMVVFTTSTLLPPPPGSCDVAVASTVRRDHCVHDSDAIVRTPSPTQLAHEAACSLAISLTFPHLYVCVCVLNLLQLP